MLLVLETGVCMARSPKTCLQASDLDAVVHRGAGAVGVDVLNVRRRFRPASAMAIFMQAIAPRPSG